jgi:hypothetical protein
MAPLPVLLALAQAWAGECTGPVTTAQLATLLAEGRAAWVSMDRAAFDNAAESRRRALPCVTEPIEPSLALEYHLAEALGWSLERRIDLERLELRAVLAIDGGWDLPPDLAPEHHRLREDCAAERAAPDEPAGPVVQVPAGVSLRVDGQDTGSVPAARSFIAQVVGPGGRVIQTAWIGAGTDPGLAVEALLAAAGPAPEPLPAATSPAPRGGIALLAGGAGLGVLAGGLYAVAAVRAGAMERGEVPCEELTSEGHRVDGLVIATGGVGLAAAGLVTAGFTVRF